MDTCVIKVEDVKRLRDETGMAMMECKKALIESGGNFEKAKELVSRFGHARLFNRRRCTVY